MDENMELHAPAGAAREQTASEPRSRRNSRLFLILSVLMLLLTLGAAAAMGVIYMTIRPYANYDRILPNVYCAGIDLGGMTREEARQAVEEALKSPSYSLRLTLPDREYTFTPAQEGITLNAESISQKAYAYGRSDDSAFGLYRAYRHAEGTEYRLDAETALEYSRADIQALAEQIHTETYIAPTLSETVCDEEAHTVTVKPGQPGRVIDTEDILQAVCGAYDSMDFSDISLEYQTVPIDMDQLRQICREASFQYHVIPSRPTVTANEEDHAIDVVMGTVGWKLDSQALYDAAAESVGRGQYEPVTVNLAQVEPLVPDLTRASEALACDPSEPYYYYGNVYEGTNGYYLDWESAARLIEDADYGASIQIPMTAVAPQKTADEIRAVLFRDQLSSYSTEYVSNSNRTNNLILACEAIDGTVLNAGEIFSFNGVVGERTADKGYRSATVYVGSESVEQLGGGVCQVASTIYDAALYAEMEITERDSHTFFVTYVPGGLDATVYWGSLDFCFRNSTEYPVRINAWVSGGYVNISIDGTRANDHVVKLGSEWLSTNPYTTVYRYDSSKPRGYEYETVYPYTGYTYEAYRYIYDGDGNLLDAEYLGTSTYEKRDRVITVGTG